MGDSRLTQKYRVLIIGGGFGGLHAARALRRANVDITLIDRRNHHLFQPLLYQVATGTLSPGDIAAPLRGILSGQSNARVVLGEAVDIDPNAKTVALGDGAVLEYDSLVVATGSQNHYFGNNQWSEHAPALKTVEDATDIRRRILYAFEAAERELDPNRRAACLTFVIVGAGATGVELAGAVAEIARHTLRNDFRDIKPEASRILLVDGAPRVLQTLPEALSSKATAALRRLGVEVRTGVFVSNIDATGVALDQRGSAERIAASTILWAGGVVASSFGRVLAARTSAETDRSGRIVVREDLTLPGFPEIYISGDLAHSQTRDGTPLPGLAQVAIQQGEYAALAIAHSVSGRSMSRPFRYVSRGDMAVIGRASAVAHVFGLHVWGFAAWLLWLAIHLLYLIEFRSRVIVLMQWAFQYMTFARAARLITGAARVDTATEQRISTTQFSSGIRPNVSRCDDTP